VGSVFELQLVVSAAVAVWSLVRCRCVVFFQLQLVVSAAVAVWSVVRCRWVVCLSYNWLFQQLLLCGL